MQNEAQDVCQCSKHRCNNQLPNEWLYKLCPTCRGHDQASKKRRKECQCEEESRRPAPCPPANGDTPFPQDNEIHSNSIVSVKSATFMFCAYTSIQRSQLCIQTLSPY